MLNIRDGVLGACQYFLKKATPENGKTLYIVGPEVFVHAPKKWKERMLIRKEGKPTFYIGIFKTKKTKLVVHVNTIALQMTNERTRFEFLKEIKKHARNKNELVIIMDRTSLPEYGLQKEADNFEYTLAKRIREIVKVKDTRFVTPVNFLLEKNLKNSLYMHFFGNALFITDSYLQFYVRSKGGEVLDCLYPYKKNLTSKVVFSYDESAYHSWDVYRPQKRKGVDFLKKFKLELRDVNGFKHNIHD